MAVVLLTMLCRSQQLRRRKKRILSIMVSELGSPAVWPHPGGTGVFSWPCPFPTLTSGPFADYQTLRIGGLVFAVVLFSVGILLILSKSVPFLYDC